MNGDDRTTYLSYLSRSGRLPPSIKALIDRYHIHMYDDDDVTADACSESVVPPSDCDNYSRNNNDDDLDPPAAGQTPPPPQPAQMPASTPGSGTSETSPSPKVSDCQSVKQSVNL